MTSKRTVSLLGLLLVASVLAVGAPAATSSHVALTIRHQLHGCHAWSLNGGSYRAQQTVAIHTGSSLTVENHDVMPHKLVELSGHAVVYTRVARGDTMGVGGTFPPSVLARMGSISRITFAHAGIYHFTTKPGEDYMAGVKTIGEDNVLRLTVRVGLSAR